MSRASSIHDAVSWFSEGPALRQPVVAAITAVQTQKPQVQILGLAAAFCCLAEAIGKDPHDIVKMINNAKDDIDSPFATQYQAMRSYAQGEFL